MRPPESVTPFGRSTEEYRDQPSSRSTKVIEHREIWSDLSVLLVQLGLISS